MEKRGVQRFHHYIIMSFSAEESEIIEEVVEDMGMKTGYEFDFEKQHEYATKNKYERRLKSSVNERIRSGRGIKSQMWIVSNADFMSLDPCKRVCRYKYLDYCF